ncbi:hypothetical protein CDD83_2218 [Cordyceps sp. RAO-2017]|nr:hypothetical protein CDD83_2218 [Cordyceps sp. RAO-2017]
MASPLGAPAVLRRMADALPAHAKGDESSDIASSYELVALLAHAFFCALDFKLCALDEDKPLPATADGRDAAVPERLPAHWNAVFGSLSFVYSHKQSSMRFVIRVDRMGGKVEVRGLAVGDDHIHRFERPVRDIVRSAALPIRITLTPAGDEDRSDLPDKLRAAFLTEQAMAGTPPD